MTHMGLFVTPHCALMGCMTHLELIGSDDAATALGIKRSSVTRWVREGRITPIGRLGKRGINVFDRADIEKIAAADLRGRRRV